jgi:hypothetical protein
MIDSIDMSTPVTRGELKAELEQFEIRLEQRLEDKLERKLEDKLERKLERKLEDKFDQKLGLWGGALMARIDGLERRFDVFEGMEQRLLAELARHARAIQESMSAQISAIDDKYADLPRRVTRLETEVFPAGGGELVTTTPDPQGRSRSGERTARVTPRRSARGKRRA